MIASWKIGGIFKADAQQVAKEICSIGDECSPQDIVVFARDERSELHKCFEWDDSIAGERYREIQAQRYLEHLLSLERQRRAKSPYSVAYL